MIELLSKWRRATNRLCDELGRMPTPEEVARVLGLPRKKLPIIKRAILIYNLTPQTEQPDNGWSLGDSIMDERHRMPDEELLASDNLNFVMQQIESMPARESAVLKRRFGLDGFEPQTLKGVGEALSLTRERVRQIEIEALQQLGESLDGVNKPMKW
jgi:RNA polymerase primary sigma factor